MVLDNDDRHDADRHVYVHNRNDADDNHDADHDPDDNHDADDDDRRLG